MKKALILAILAVFVCVPFALANDVKREATIEITKAQDTNFLTAFQRENEIYLSDTPYFYLNPILSTEKLTGIWWGPGADKDAASSKFDTSLGASDPNFAYYWDSNSFWINRLGANALGEWHIQKVEIDGISVKTNSINYKILEDKVTPPVPEPISSSLFLLGAGALAFKKFRRKKA